MFGQKISRICNQRTAERPEALHERLGRRFLEPRGRLVRRLQDYEAPPLPISLVYPSQRHVPLRARCPRDV